MGIRCGQCLITKTSGKEEEYRKKYKVLYKRDVVAYADSVHKAKDWIRTECFKGRFPIELNKTSKRKDNYVCYE